MVPKRGDPYSAPRLADFIDSSKPWGGALSSLLLEEMAHNNIPRTQRLLDEILHIDDQTNPSYIANVLRSEYDTPFAKFQREMVLS